MGRVDFSFCFFAGMESRSGPSLARSPEILLPKSLRLEKISRHSLSLCCFTSAENWALEPSKMKLGNLLWQVALSKTVDVSKAVSRAVF